MVGRERETEQLAAHRRAASEGHGRIVLLAGEAGIGKSRVLRSFEATVASGRSALATSRCVEFVSTPLAPLRELLHHLESRGSSALDPRTQALVSRLTFEPNTATSDGWLPEGSLFESIDAAFARFAVHSTVVLTIEDLQWADRSTLAFRAVLADRVDKRRILVVATYRPDEINAQYPHLSEFSAFLSKRSVSTISLSPLDGAAVRTLIEHAAAQEALAPATIAQIVRRSEGNPFFVEELVKSALDAGRRSPSTDLPLSIRAAILARAAQLSEADRDIISLATVLGQRFAVEQLIAIAKRNRSRVVHALERARSLRLLSDDAAVPGEVAFRHALTQEVLYAELLAERVRPLHEAIAGELELRSDRATRSVELAHHWRRAGDVNKAAIYDEIAGDGAFAIGAFADAILYYERGLAARPEDSQLLHKLGVAFGAVNELRAGIERLRAAGALYWKAGDFEGFAENSSSIVAQLHNSGEVAAAIATCHEVITTLDGKLAPAKLDLFRTRLAFQCLAVLDDASASAFLDDVREPVEDPRVATHLFWNRFRIAAMRGEIDKWRLLTARALQAAALLDDGGSWVRFLHCQIALDAVGLGETDTAREHFHAAIPPKREMLSNQETMLAAASSLEHALRGDFARAARLLREGGSPVQNYPVLVHARSSAFVLGICSGDDTLLKGDDTESFLRYGLEREMKVAIGLLGGPYAWALGLRGRIDEAAEWIARIAPALPTPHRFSFAYLAAAQFGRPDDVRAMREKLRNAAARPQDRVNKAALALFDAFAAQRGLVSADASASALDAASRFEAIGWPWLAARAYEVAGDTQRAVETYRKLGSVRDLHRVEVERTGDVNSFSILSSRELEVADLVARGHSNDEIAQILHISSRTAEKHVSSALKKLNLRSRVQLGRVLVRSQSESR